MIHLDEEHVGLLLADVADKSIQAALFMAVSRTLFLVESKHSLSPVAVALAVHQGMLDVAVEDDVFVTAFYGVLHRPSGRLTYVIAGHERPLLARPGLPVQTIPGRGRFLGMLEELELQENTIQLATGDRLLIFSDGVPDAVDRHNRNYGLQRLSDFLLSQVEASAPQIVARIPEHVASWCRGAPPFDDLTLLCVEARH